MKKKMKYRIEVLRNLYPYTHGVRGHWGILILFSVVAAGLEFISPLIYSFFIDDVILGANLSQLKTVIISYLVLYLAGVFTGYIKNWASYTLVNTVLYRARQKILNNFFEVPFPEYESTSVGDRKMRIDDDTKYIEAFTGSQTIGYLVSCATVIVCSVVLMRMSWGLAAFAFVTIPFTFWLDHRISKSEKVVMDSWRENQQKTSSWLHATVQGWREIKALNLAKNSQRKFTRFLHINMLHFVKWINYWTARVLIVPKIKNECFMQFGLYFIGGLLIIAGELRAGDLLVCAVYYSMLSDAIKKVSNADADLQSQMPYTDRLMESLNSQTSIKIDGIVPDDTQTIELKDVSFRYPNTENPVLTNFSLSIKKGERVAITGKSGSGKSTILKLITGMISPTEGSVCFSGVDLKEINISAMHSKMGFVMQENILFHTTIRENLLYGKRNATEDELLDACKKACIYDFILELPEGLDTLIGERGIKLSGGQRQRIVLARLFLQHVDIFIFDEATSALDQYSENIIQDAIRNIAKEKTILVVAHRESSISLCERVINIS